MSRSGKPSHWTLDEDPCLVVGDHLPGMPHRWQDCAVYADTEAPTPRAEPFDETPTPPATPIRARKAGLDTDSRSMPAIQARPRSIAWPRIRAAFYFLLPYLIVIGVAISGALTLKGHTP